MMSKDSLVAFAKILTGKISAISPDIVCAICEQESSWEPWSMRYEPAFYSRYVEPIFDDGKLSVTEARGRAISWGLMQTMGQSVRELGYADRLPALCDPQTGVEWGCRLFSEKLRVAQGNYERALLLWNGGADPSYAAAVLEKSEKYR